MTASPADPQTRLSRSVSGRLLYLFILGDVLGAGVYALVGVMAGEVGGPVWLPLLVALGLALLTAVALLNARGIRESLGANVAMTSSR